MVIGLAVQGSNYPYSNIVSDNGLSPTRRQAIIWSNDDKFTDASLGPNGLKHTSIYGRHLNTMNDEYSMVWSVAVVHIPCKEIESRWRTISGRYQWAFDTVHVPCNEIQSRWQTTWGRYQWAFDARVSTTRKYVPRNTLTFLSFLFCGGMWVPYELRWSIAHMSRVHFARIETILRLPQCQRNKPEGYRWYQNI